MNNVETQRGAFDFRVLVVLGVVMVALLGVAYFFYGLGPNADEASPQSFTIAKGEGFRTIGADLSQESLIKSITVFKLYSLLAGEAQKFKPGVYTLSGAMSVPQIVSILTENQRNDVLVTIPEGMTLRDIDATLAEAGVTNPGDIENFSYAPLAADYPFLKDASSSLEGFLFPDTYYFERGSSPETVVRRMLDTFQEKAWPLLGGTEDWYRTLTLASILEREVANFDDRRIVAGILLKRFSLHMPLQVDATVVYAECDGLLKGCDTTLTKSAFSLPSPYNTYVHQGFPPTPIANPGEMALKAALSPETSQFLYYLSAPKTGITYFSKTLEEQNKNQAKYL